MSRFNYDEHLASDESCWRAVRKTYRALTIADLRVLDQLADTLCEARNVSRENDRLRVAASVIRDHADEALT